MSGRGHADRLRGGTTLFLSAKGLQYSPRRSVCRHICRLEKTDNVERREGPPTPKQQSMRRLYRLSAQSCPRAKKKHLAWRGAAQQQWSRMLVGRKRDVKKCSAGLLSATARWTQFQSLNERQGQHAYEGQQWTATDEERELHEDIVSKSTKKVPSDVFRFAEQSLPKRLKVWAEADFVD